MEYRPVPGTNLRLSSLALGGWLTLGDAVPEADSLRILWAAVDGGINFLDLADMYAAGGAERVVGKFLREVRREQVVVSSKVFWPTSDDPADRGLSRRHIHASIDRTLGRLGVDRLGPYFCHREDPAVPLAETVQAMGDLVRAGKVAAWGTSCWRPATLRAAHRLALQLGVEPPRVEQPPYSLLERSIENELVACCRELGMAIVVWSPLAGGVLTGKYLNGVPPGSRGAGSNWLEPYLRPAAVTAVRAFVGACRERGVAPGVVALAWAMGQPGIAAAISGATSEAQLRSNLQAAEFAVDEGLRRQLDGWFGVGRRPLWKRVMRGVLRKFGGR